MKSFLSTLVVALAATSLEAAPADNGNGELVARGFRDQRCGFWYGSCSPGLCCNIWGYCGSTSDYCSIGCQKIYGRCDDGRKPTTTTKKPTPTPTPTPLKKMNEQCGSRHGTCESGLCCSDWGRCGDSFLHCYIGCQKKYGDCGDKKKTTTTSSTIKPTQTTKSSSTTTATTSSSTKNSSTETSTTASSTTETSTTASSTTATSATGSSTTETSTTVSTTAATSSISTTPSTTTTTTAPTSTPIKLSYLDEQCGPSAGTCAPGLCCSEWGWCGYTSDHCTGGCQKDFGSCNDKTEAEVITRCTAPGTFAVTFDDGPSVLTSGLLDYLDRVNVKATFFVNGLNEKNGDTGNPTLSIYDLADVVRRAYTSGHQICSHTWAHTDIITVYEDEVVYEMSRLNHAFSKILGTVPTCMRPPYGDTDGPSRQILHKMGYTVVTWNMDPVDWNPVNSIDEMYQEYVDQTGPTNPQVGKFISLNHDVWNTTADFRPTNYPKTIPLAERSIEYLLSRGWKLVNLADCLESPPFYREPNPSDESCGEDECF